jgi:tripartite-type tricarboxylate transporter receptor subunit TctC
VKRCGIFGPAATHAAIINELGTEIIAAVKAPEMRDFTLREGADPAGHTPQEFAEYFKARS